jgi:RNA polymerase sigma-70 factor, ECF subfamily
MLSAKSAQNSVVRRAFDRPATCERMGFGINVATDVQARASAPASTKYHCETHAACVVRQSREQGAIAELDYSMRLRRDLAPLAPSPAREVFIRSQSCLLHSRAPQNMADHSPPDVTALLADLNAGASGAAERLAAVVIDELHHIAERAMRREVEGHTLQPTELVNEALMRLLGQEHASWVNRSQFFAVASQTIRRILVDHARRRLRAKRDHGVRVTLDEGVAEVSGRSLDLIALDDALQQLDTLAPRQARVVELRFFGGLDIDETAAILEISPATVKRDWTFARAFLLRTLEAA